MEFVLISTSRVYLKTASFLFLSLCFVALSTAQTNDTNGMTTLPIDPTNFMATTDSIQSIDAAFDVVSDLLLVCTCDLMPNTCDINCCCDIDCSSDERLTFISCDDFNSEAVSTDYCFSSRLFFRQNSPFYSGVDGTDTCFNLTDLSTINYMNVPSLIESSVELADYEIRYSVYINP